MIYYYLNREYFNMSRIVWQIHRISTNNHLFSQKATKPTYEEKVTKSA